MKQFNICLAIAITLVIVASPEPCVEQSPCYCHLGDGSYIDVGPIGNSRFDLIDLSGVYKYSIELCQTFNVSNDCENVYGCQYNNESGRFNVLGRSNPTFVDKSTMKMQNGSSITYINLVCTSGVDVFRFSDTFPGISPYNFTLETKYACPQQNSSTRPPSPVTSTPTNHSPESSSTKSVVTTTAATTRSGSSSTPTGTSRPTPSSATASSSTQKTRSTTVNLHSTTHNGEERIISSIEALTISIATSVLLFSKFGPSSL